jgi:hypothetical protein
MFDWLLDLEAWGRLAEILILALVNLLVGFWAGYHMGYDFGREDALQPKSKK